MRIALVDYGDREPPRRGIEGDPGARRAHPHHEDVDGVLLDRHEPLVVEFGPPQKMKPAELGLILDQSADTKDVTEVVIKRAEDMIFGQLRRWLPICTWRLCLRAASTISSPSRGLCPHGFSM